MKIRDPYFALQGWYPADQDRCREAVLDYLTPEAEIPPGKAAGIVPHAGWVFSGRVAGLTFAALRALEPSLVFLFGGHMRRGARPVCMPSGAFGTPLGPVEVDEPIAAELVRAFGCDEETPEHFEPDNTLELQMPFIRTIWPTARVVAAAVPPDSTAEAIGTWAARTAERAKRVAVAIGSTDLTHYGANYGFTPKGFGEEAHRWSKERNDRPFLERLLAFDATGAIAHALDHHSACCPGAAAAAVGFAKTRGITAGQLLAHTTSHEEEGRGRASMWVGYASIVF
jgi:MEMO1 family protein